MIATLLQLHLKHRSRDRKQLFVGAGTCFPTQLRSCLKKLARNCFCFSTIEYDVDDVCDGYSDSQAMLGVDHIGHRQFTGFI